MNEQEKTLLELLAAVNGIEIRCQHLQAPIAVPPSVYEHLGHLRNELARWGIENITAAKTGGRHEWE